MNNRNEVVLIDEDDNQIGVMEKLEAHIKGQLHRAFSIFVFNKDDELLLQKRADSKYHSPGLWTNSCCSHPSNGETYFDGANDRLLFEMGISCELREVYSFIYRADFSNGLIEHEYDRIFLGYYNDEEVIYNEDEVGAIKWVNIKDLYEDMDQNPNQYTEWFKILMEKNRKDKFLYLR